jgi:hypothetical protein
MKGLPRSSMVLLATACAGVCSLVDTTCIALVCGSNHILSYACMSDTYGTFAAGTQAKNDEESPGGKGCEAA